jgi:hypothetical protein
VREYLGHFSHASLVLCEHRDDLWLGLPAEPAPGGVKVEGLAPVLLARDAQLFDPVRVRWDGIRFLFEGKNLRRDPSVAAFLREALAREVQPEALERPGLLPAEREAYRYQWALRREAKRKTAERRAEGAEERLRRAVAHADGRLHSFMERDDHYAVTFTVDGVRHTSTVHKGDLSVMVAGICLSGEDDKFDLPSLVGVLREGQGTGAPRVGDEGMPVEVYREIHPRRRGRRR